MVFGVDWLSCRVLAVAPPFFSVIVPLYNKAANISRALHSVVSQSFADFEVLVVDDGSTDGGGRIVASMPDPRLTCVRQENKGVSSARNLGVRLAAGKYVAFLDADDEWLDDHLERLHALIKVFPDVGFYSTAHQILRDGVDYVPSTGLEVGEKRFIKNVFPSFEKGLGLVNSTTACLERGNFLSLGGFPEGVNVGEDVYLWLRAALTGGLAFDNSITAIYHQDSDNRTATRNYDEMPYYVEWLDEEIKLCRLPLEISMDADKFLRKAILMQAAGLRLAGRGRQAGKFGRLDICRRSYWARMQLGLVRVAPVCVLRFLRKYRHRKL